MNDTGAALAGVAADMGARQVQMVAQEIDKEGPVLDLSRDRLAVHCQFDCRHVETSPCFLIAPIRSTGPGLCNNDFCRGSHCDAVCASRRTPPALPSWLGLPRPSTSLVAAKCKTVDARHKRGHEDSPAGRPNSDGLRMRAKNGGHGEKNPCSRHEARRQIYRLLSILL